MALANAIARRFSGRAPTTFTSPGVHPAGIQPTHQPVGGTPNQPTHHGSYGGGFGVGSVHGQYTGPNSVPLMPAAKPPKKGGKGGGSGGHEHDHDHGGSGGSGGGKGPKKPKKGSIAEYLALDEDFQNALNQLSANFGALRTQNQTQRGNLRTDYIDTKRRLAEGQAESNADMKEDFASRGLFGSGVYQKEFNDKALDWRDQFGDAQTSFLRNRATLLSDLADARRLKQQKVQDAKLAAIRRRAAELGITS